MGVLVFLTLFPCIWSVQPHDLFVTVKESGADTYFATVDVALLKSRELPSDFPVLALPALGSAFDLEIEVNTFKRHDDYVFIGGLSPTGAPTRIHFWMYYSASMGIEGAIEFTHMRTAYQISSEDGFVVLKKVPLHHIVGDPLPSHNHEQDEGAEERAVRADPRKVTTRNLNNLPALNSKPDATSTILLDFDGYLVDEGPWLSDNGGAPIDAEAYSRDDDHTTYSELDITEMTNCWKRVAEDFRPFDVTVTTLESVYQAAPANSRMRTIVSPTDDWYPSAGGVAYLRSFRSTYAAVCWVFSERLSGGRAKSMAEAASHEVGHTLGLSHDGLDGPSPIGYYSGHGTSPVNWSPIMGVGYSTVISQWSKGEYLDANQLQDDLEIITTDNNFDYRADDYGNTIATASVLSTAGGLAEMAGQGIIETRADVDYFRIEMVNGPNLQINVESFEEGPNLDVRARLFDSSGALVETANPNNQHDAQLSFSGPTGTYYLEIDGVGFGQVNINSYSSGTLGYSDYGSLGTYYIYIYDGPPCGDGVVDTGAGEECDEGFPYNPNDCCSDTCTFLASGDVCRAAEGLCGRDETCSGSSVTCPSDTHRSSGYVCRPSAGDCDLDEVCAGGTDECPADEVEAAGTSCRVAAGVCDVADECDGTNKQCTTDVFQPSTLLCREAVGDCDVDEFCTGSTSDCPPDDKHPASFVCRPPVGLCDTAELCDGTTDACPADERYAAGHACRPRRGFCDLEEVCSGASNSCPPDLFNDDGLVCDDGFNCTANETCLAGQCVGESSCVCGNGILEPFEECDDNNTLAGDCCSSTCTFEAVNASCTSDGIACTLDQCDAAGTCLHVHIPDNGTCDDGNICNGPDLCFNLTCSIHLGGIECLGGVEVVNEEEGASSSSGATAAIVIVVIILICLCCIVVAAAVIMKRKKDQEKAYGYADKAPAPTTSYALAPAPPASSTPYKAIYDFTGGAGELTFRVGDVIHVTEVFDDGWASATFRGVSAAAPISYLEKELAEPSRAAPPPPTPSPPPPAAATPPPPAATPPSRSLPALPPAAQEKKKKPLPAGAPPPKPAPAARPPPPAGANRPPPVAAKPPPLAAKPTKPPAKAAKPPPVARKPAVAAKPRKKPAGDYVITTHDYVSENPDELQFYPNERIRVLERFDDGWANGVLNGQTGFFALSYTKPAPCPPVRKPKPQL